MVNNDDFDPATEDTDVDIREELGYKQATLANAKQHFVDT